MPTADFNYIEKIFTNFFHRQKIQSTLSFFDKHGITGWEKYFQLEFARHLEDYEDNPEWWIESSLEFDRRMEKVKTLLRPDLLLRKKGWKSETYSIIEMKQKDNCSICVSEMVRDLNKVYKVKSSELEIRNIIAIGVHKRSDKSIIKKDIIKKLGQFDWDTDDMIIKIYHIPNTSYGYTLIGYDYA